MGEGLGCAGHANACARIFSPSTGRAVCTLPGHVDAVSSVAMDPRGGYEVATGSHDGVLRFFDLRSGRCLQELSLHQRKFDEAIHSFHHGGDRIVTAGADATIAVLG